MFLSLNQCFYIMYFFLDTSEDASVAIMLEGYGSQLVFTEKHSAETVDNC